MSLRVFAQAISDRVFQTCIICAGQTVYKRSETKLG